MTILTDLDVVNQKRLNLLKSIFPIKFKKERKNVWDFNIVCKHLENLIMPINAQQVYEDMILNVKPDSIIGLKKGKVTYSGLKDRVSTHLASRTAQQQFEFDVALWYGFLVKAGGTTWKKTMVKRIMALLYYGGLMANRGQDPDIKTNARADWRPWCEIHPEGGEPAPICSAISHTARIVVWLPENDSNNGFWKWLWADDYMNVQSRMAATHGLCAQEEVIIRRAIGFNVIKGMKEVKGNENAGHFGVNIALGGNGNTHPISGKGIRENGKHGHLYIAGYRGKVSNRRAILLGTEQSSPIDRQVAVKGKFGKLKGLGRKLSVPDQYGGKHGLGGHNRFSATGGDDFSYKKTIKLKREKKTDFFIKGKKRKRRKIKIDTNLEDYGPSWGHYIDGMYVDLTMRRFKYVKRMLNSFTVSMIAEPGTLPQRR